MTHDERSADSCRRAVLEVADAIAIPDFFRGKLDAACRNLDWTEGQRLARALTGAAASAAQDELAARWPQESDDGAAILAVSLLAAQLIRPEFERLGLGDDVWVETMRAFPRFIAETKRLDDHEAYDRSFWTWRQLSLRLVRLGTLEHEYIVVPARGDGDAAEQPLPYYMPLPQGSWIAAGTEAPQPNDDEPYAYLSVHIPSDAWLDREALDASYRDAVSCFARLHALNPERYPLPVRFIACYTWLLAPALLDILGPQSGIRRFAEDYLLTRVDEEKKGYWHWVYGKYEGPTEGLPEDSSLQRGIKARLLAGRGIGEAGGPLRAETLERTAP